MNEEKERLQAAQWVLERNLAWIAAAEVKVGAVVTIDTAMLAGLGVAFTQANSQAKTQWVWLLTTSAAIALGLGLLCAAMAIMPRGNGPAKSLLFFGQIGPCPDAEYIQNFRKASMGELLEDWTAQIHRNAQIACEKFDWVKKAMWCSFLSIPAWVPAIALLLK